MMRKMITTALLTAAAALALAPSAQADDYKDYNDATANFVVYTDLASAINAKANHKQVLASINGLDHPIYCKGTFPAGPFVDCMQHDDFGWYHLQPNQLPQIGTVWTHLS